MLANFEELKKAKRFFDDEELIKKELYNSLDNAVEKLVSENKETPVAFSGGLDSIISYLASKYTRPVLYCIGFKNSHDVANSQKSAKVLGLDLEMIYLDGLDLSEYLKKTIKIVKTDDRLITDLNVPLFIILEELKKQNHKAFISGQGADTLFGGFARYPYNKKFGEEMFLDTKNIYKTNLKYNFKVCDYFGVKPLFPFLEEEVVKLAIRINPNLKIKNGVQKYILREAFRKRLPKSIIEQQKKSFQYGNGIHRALRRLNNRSCNKKDEN